METTPPTTIPTDIAERTTATESARRARRSLRRRRRTDVGELARSREVLDTARDALRIATFGRAA